MKIKIAILPIIIILLINNVYAQNNWILSTNGFDQTFSPADLVTASNGDIYVYGVKYDNGVSGYINKLYKSTDQGASWTTVPTSGLTNLGNVLSLKIIGNKMILSGQDVVTTNVNIGKIFTSIDNGTNWSLSMTGYDQTYTPTDFVSTGNGDLFVSAVKYDAGLNSYINKLYKSTDQGSSWSVVQTSGLDNLGNILSISLSGNKMILSGQDVVSTNTNIGKIFTSSDYGVTWTLSISGYDQTYSPSDFVTASNGDIYVSGVKYDNGINGYTNKLFKSSDQGLSWTVVTTSGLTNLGNILSLEISGNKMILSGQDLVLTNPNIGKIFTSTISSTTGINDLFSTSKTVTIYPNPFLDILQINIDSINPKSIKLISISGTEVLKQTSFANQIKTEEIQPGSYLLILDFENESQIYKVVK
jgi:photosystem II stability/assembly factor-like uncharacterized protein